MLCVKGVTRRSSSERGHRLRIVGLVLGLIGTIGFTATIAIQALFSPRGWYGELPVYVLSSSLSLVVTLAIAWKRELIGGPMLIVETLVLEGLPYMQGVSPVEATQLTGILYPLFGLALLSSGSLLIYSWKENQILSPEKRQRELHHAGFIIGLITVIVLTPAYLSGAFGLAMGEQTNWALLLLFITVTVWIGVGISWKWSLSGGIVLTLLSIVGLFVVFVTKPTFVWWSLPQLANLPLVTLLPMASGTISLFSWREEFYISRNHKESSRKLLELERKVPGAKWKSQ